MQDEWQRDRVIDSIGPSSSEDAGGGGGLDLVKREFVKSDEKADWLIVDPELPDYPLAEFRDERSARDTFDALRTKGQHPYYSRDALETFLWEGPFPGDLDPAELSRDEFVDALHLHLWWLATSGDIGRQAQFTQGELGDGALLRTSIEIDLSSANLKGLRLDGVDLRDVELTGADLSGATLTNCDLGGVDLEGTTLTDTDLSGSNLRGAKGVVFDGTRVQQTRFLPGSSYAWFVLRRVYTGPRMFFHLGLLAIALVPVILEVTSWLAVNRAQEAFVELVPVADTNGSNAEVDSVGRSIGPCLAVECQEWRIWQLVLGLNQSLSQMLLVVALTAYNLLRLLLTWRIGPLRDEEDLIGVTPRRRQYMPLYWAHRGIRILLVVALASFAYRVFDWFFLRKVWLPAA